MPIRLLPRPSDGLAEQPEGADKQHERQQQGHPAERAVDDRSRRCPGTSPGSPTRRRWRRRRPRARLNRAAPSRRSSGARSLTSWPIRRTPPPTTWPMPSQAPAAPRAAATAGRCSTAASWRVRAVPVRAGGPAGFGCRGAGAAAGGAAGFAAGGSGPLGAEVVRVAIPATVPESGRNPRISGPAAGYVAGPGTHKRLPVRRKRARLRTREGRLGRERWRQPVLRPPGPPG